MAIDFTKPIQKKDNLTLDLEVLHHDETHVYYKYNNIRVTETIETFSNQFENVPVEPRKFKAYIGLKKLIGMDRIDSSTKKENLVDNGFEQIQEVEFISGEGNN
jgi:hypothetical protein